PLVAGHVQLESFFWPDGSAAHCATYQVKYHSAVDVKISLPSETRLIAASIDSLPLDITSPKDKLQSAIIHLPAQTRPTRLALYLESRGLPLAANHKLAPPIALGELPYLDGDWTIWLPGEFAVSGSSVWSATQNFNWRQRLFGLLGRPSGAR